MASTENFQRGRPRQGHECGHSRKSEECFVGFPPGVSLGRCYATRITGGYFVYRTESRFKSSKNAG